MSKEGQKAYFSYMPVLRHLAKVGFSPRHIVEWGPGKSTITMAKMFPNASILSIEHDPNWFNKLDRTLKDKKVGNVELKHFSLTLMPAIAHGYVGFPILKHLSRKRRYDLAFVDGRFRMDCLLVARMILAPNGIVILHDAHRKVYEPGIRPYRFKRMYKDIITAVLALKPTHLMDGFTIDEREKLTNVKG